MLILFIALAFLGLAFFFAQLADQHCAEGEPKSEVVCLSLFVIALLSSGLTAASFWT